MYRQLTHFLTDAVYRERLSIAAAFSLAAVSASTMPAFKPSSRRKTSQPLAEQKADFRAQKQSASLSKRSNLLGTRPQLSAPTAKHNTATQPTDPTVSTASPAPTSRLCLKNLPAHYTETDITRHFSTLPDVQLTDVRLMRTPDGRSRKFAFIGLRTAEEAERVRRYYDRNYIDMARIDVQFALERGSGQLERAWSKYSKDSSRHTQQQPQHDEAKEDDSRTATDGQHSATNKQAKPDKSSTDPLASLLSSVLPADKAASLTADPLFHDYMQAMGGTRKAKFWENDDSAGGVDDVAVEGAEEKERAWKMMKGAGDGVGDVDGASDDEYEDAPVIGGGDETEESKEAAETNQQNGHRSAKGSVSDADFLKAKQSKAFDDDGEVAEDSAEQDEEAEEDEAETQGTTPSITQTTPPIELDDTRLFICNLPFTITQDDIHSHFSHYGPIDSIHVPTTADGSGKGFAFVTYANASHAQHAMQAMNNRVVMGRLIHILPSQKRPTTDGAGEETSGSTEKESTYKQQKQKALKKAANDSTHSNTLFLRADTVMASMAERLQVTKGDILDVEGSGSLAVRLALAESHLINETKEWLKQQGVNVTALERTGEAETDAELRAAVKRSDRVVLCKNIPYETEQSELRTMFGKFGALVRVVLPPSKTLALVEYEQPAQAKKGYTALAYTKYHHVPLYLEWAPIDTFTAKPAAVPTAAAAIVPTSAATVTAAADSESADGGGNTIFVKNLSFATTEQSLLDLFKAATAVRSVHIATKKNSSKAVAAGGSKVLSMGYGFVELRTGEDVKAVISRMQGVQLDGHALELKPSTRSLATTATGTASAATTGEPASGTTEATSRRLIVKNLPFEATTDEVRALFKPFASVTRVRLPRKMDGSHRGYGFIDFTSGEEAGEAMARLGHTHLYGRSLVLQRSDEREEGGDEGEGVEAGDERVRRQREKVKRQYEQSRNDMPAHKRSKKIADDDDM